MPRRSSSRSAACGRPIDEDPDRSRDTRALHDRYVAIAAELGKISVPYDDWQVLYRETVQLGRALDGEPQLLELALIDGQGPPPAARPRQGATGYPPAASSR